MTDGVVTAQQTYRRLHREFIAPELRRLGFNGSAGRYHRKGPTGHIATLMFHLRSAGRDRVRFWVTFGVASRYLIQYDHAAGLPRSRIPASVLERDWTEDLFWLSWGLGAEEDPYPVAMTILDLLHVRVIPALQASLTDEGLRRAVDRNPAGVGNAAPRTLLEIAAGNLDEAVDRLAWNEAVNPGHPGTAFLRERFTAVFGHEPDQVPGYLDRVKERQRRYNSG